MSRAPLLALLVSALAGCASIPGTVHEDGMDHARASFAVGAALDYATTEIALRHGGVEVNRMVSVNPRVLLPVSDVIVASVAELYARAAWKCEQKFNREATCYSKNLRVAKWLYYSGAVVRFGFSVNNWIQLSKADR